MLDHRSKCSRWYREVISWMLCRAEFLRKNLICRGIVVVAVHILQKSGKSFERRRIQTPMLLDAVFCPLLEPVQGPASPGDTNHWHVEVSPPCHLFKGRKDFFIGHFAGGAKEDECVESELIPVPMPLFPNDRQNRNA